MKLRFGLPVIAVGILIASGVAHGLRSDRWGENPDAVAASERLKHLPTTIGNWYSSEQIIHEREFEASGALGYISRRYVSRDDGTAVNVMILCGRHGPIAIHPPTVCFVGAGWNLNASPKVYPVQSEQKSRVHEFWLADFQKSTSGVTYTMRTFWAWAVTGEWQAADHPRIQYAASPYLYKIYVTYIVEEKDEPVDGSTSVEFLKLLLAELDKSVFDRGNN